MIWLMLNEYAHPPNLSETMRSSLSVKTWQAENSDKSVVVWERRLVRELSSELNMMISGDD